MRRTHRAARTLIGVIVVTLALLAPLAASAQVGPGSRTLINGQILTWSDYYELDTATVTVVDGVELIDLYSGFGWFNVITTNFPAYGSVLRDLSVQDLQSTVPLRQIDRGDYDNVSYSLDTTNYDGVEVGLFTLVIELANYAQLTMLVAPVDVFQYEMQIAQADLTIGGTGVFQGVDPVAMQGHLTRATGVALIDLNAAVTTPPPVQPPAAPPTPALPPAQTTPVAPPVQTTPVAPPAQTTPAGGIALPPLQTTPAAPPAQPTTPAAMAPSGSVQVGTGVTVQHTADWIAMEGEAGAPVNFLSITPPMTLVSVYNAGPETNPIPAAQLGPTLMGQFPDLADAQVVASADAPDGRKVAVLLDPGTDGNVYRIYELTPSATAATLVQVSILEPDLVAGVQLVNRTIQVNGQPLLADLATLFPQLFPGGV